MYIIITMLLLNKDLSKNCDTITWKGWVFEKYVYVPVCKSELGGRCGRSEPKLFLPEPPLSEWLSYCYHPNGSLADLCASVILDSDRNRWGGQV